MTTRSEPDARHVVLTVNACWNLLNFRRRLVERLLEDGHRVTVLAPEDDHADELIAMGCAFRPLPFDPASAGLLDQGRLLWSFGRALRALRADIVFGFTVKNNVFGALAAARLGIPFVPNVTGLGTAFLGSAGLRRAVETLYRVVLRSCPLVFFQNPDDRALFVRQRLVREERTALLPGSGIDLERFAPSPWPATDEAGSSVLMIARLLRDKGIGEYLEAGALLRRRGVDVKLALLGAPIEDGRGYDATRIVAECAAAGIDYRGVVQDVRPAIAGAHAVVLPSYREGAPRVLIEAAAMARPAIASDVPGCSFVVADGETGFLCAPRDGHALAAAIERFVALGPDRQRAMGQAARVRAEEIFSDRAVIAAYREAIALYANRVPPSPVHGARALARGVLRPSRRDPPH